MTGGKHALLILIVMMVLLSGCNSDTANNVIVVDQQGITIAEINVKPLSGILYNKESFFRAGLRMPNQNDNWSWQALMVIARKLTYSDGIHWGIGLAEPVDYSAASYPTRSYIDSLMAYKCIYPYMDSSALDQFKKGNVAMIVVTPGVAEISEDRKWHIDTAFEFGYYPWPTN